MPHGRQKPDRLLHFWRTTGWDGGSFFKGAERLAVSSP
jgi:hypothetical protein